MAESSFTSADGIDPCVRVYGTRVHNLRGVDVAAPRDALVAFTGISGSGKSSLAFGTIYAEAQRRYFESVAPYARRLLLPTGAPKVDDITGLPPAVALQQRRGGSATSRSTVGTVTTLSNLLRMLFSRAGTYPPGATERLDSDAFSPPNTAVGACPQCHGLGRIHRVTEETLVPDPSLTIRDGAVAAWPGAWQGQNLRDILVTLGGYDIDRPWKKNCLSDNVIGSCSPMSSQRWKSIRLSTRCRLTTTTTAPSPAPNVTYATRWPTRRAR